MIKVGIDEIRQRSLDIFLKAGLSPGDAKIMTEVLLTTEMRGVATHGFVRIKRYVECLKKGGISRDGSYDVLYDSPSWAALDGRGGLGIVISHKAAALAVSKAKESGVCIVNVKNSHHFGAAGYYSMMCAEEGMAGLAMSNGDVLVAATGSCEKTIGNNPLSFAAPAGKYKSIVYDIAMSMVSDMKIIGLLNEGREMPEGWVIDKDGNNTKNPADYIDRGVLLPFGGYKGYGLAMMVETLAAVLSGSAVTNEVHAWNTEKGKSGNTGHFFMAIDVSRLMPLKVFEERVEKMIDNIKSSKKAKGAGEILYPGELEHRNFQKSRDSGFLNLPDSCVELISEAERMLN